MNIQSAEDFLTWLDKIQGLSAVGLVCLTCIVVGYACRFIKWIPNGAIPVIVILWGALFMMLLADARPTTMPRHVWEVRNLCTGLIIGFIAWMVHKIALSKLEDFISTKFNLGDTQFFSKSDVQPQQPAPAPKADAEPKPNP